MILIILYFLKSQFRFLYNLKFILFVFYSLFNTFAGCFNEAILAGTSPAIIVIKILPTINNKIVKNLNSTKFVPLTERDKLFLIMSPTSLLIGRRKI